MPETTRKSALWTVVAVSTVAQLAMVIAGHFVEPVALLFGPLGTGISLAAGLAFAVLDRPAWSRALSGGRSRAGCAR